MQSKGKIQIAGYDVWKDLKKMIKKFDSLNVEYESKNACLTTKKKQNKQKGKIFK